MAHYTLDNAWEHARERLALFQAYLDPWSVGHLEALGVSAGWHCLDVGAGSGSIAEWLCRCVGPTGRVVATDIDTRFLEILQEPNLDVRRHNVVTDPLPEAAFDLVHTRAVLMHLPEREQAIRRMVSALKPGGWFLAEEGDFSSYVPDPTVGTATVALFTKGWAAADQIYAAGGTDNWYGRRLYGDLCAAGLVDVQAEGRVRMIRGGSPHARLFRLTFTQLRERMVAAGLLTDQAVEQFLTLYDDPNFVSMSLVMMAVWGRRTVA
jgi:SAM-dependent methyltransferase